MSGSRADPRELAVEYLLSVRSGSAETSRIEQQLAALREPELRATLADDASRLAFWLDVYNSAVQQQPLGRLSSWPGRVRFFGRPAVTVAGRRLSLDDIEHGLLRRSRPKIGLGYLTHPWPSAFERRHRVVGVDPRIHFALNCGAASCPPIATYQAADIDRQLDLATRTYLGSEARLEASSLLVPSIFLWFIGDFGGPSGVRAFLRRHGVSHAGRPLRFAGWDWTPRAGRWAHDDPESGASVARRDT